MAFFAGRFALLLEACDEGVKYLRMRELGLQSERRLSRFQKTLRDELKF